MINVYLIITLLVSYIIYDKVYTTTQDRGLNINITINTKDGESELLSEIKNGEENSLIKMIQK